MNPIISEQTSSLAPWSQQTDILSIYAVLEHLTDPRGKQGKRYSLALILPFVLLAKAAGETTLQAVAEWIRLWGAWLQEVLPGIRSTFPCAATSSNVLRSVDPEELTTVLMGLVTQTSGERKNNGMWPWMAKPYEERRSIR